MADIEIEVEKKDNYPEFTVAAESLSDLEDGEEREVLALIRKKPDGKFCLVEIEGYGVNEGEEAEGEEEDTEVQEDEDMGITDETPFDEAVMARVRKLA